MDHKIAKAFGLFFFYCTLDEKQALLKASDAHDIFIKSHDKKADADSYLIKITNQFIKKIKNRSTQQQVFILKSEYIRIKCDLEIWSLFIKQTRSEDVALLVWYYLLGIPIETISHSLNTSVSTLQMRLSKIVFRLGEIHRYRQVRPNYEVKKVPKTIPFSKYNKREVTEFHSLGLAWDYLQNQLDPVRKKYFTEALKKYWSLQEKIDLLKDGETYLQEISKIEIDNEILEQIEIPTTYFDLLVDKLQADTWPDSLKWILEAFTVSICVTFFAVTIPWGKVHTYFFRPKDQLYTLVTMSHSNKLVRDEEQGPENKETPVYAEDEEDAKKADATQESSPLAKPVSAEAPGDITKAPAKKPDKVIKPSLAIPIAKNASVESTPELVPSETDSPTPATETAPPSEAASTNATATEALPTSEATTMMAEESAETNEANKQKVGFLYRGILTTANVPVVSPKIKEKIESIGGRKAANAELGWRNSPTTSYFHFTVPESKYVELDEFLKSYGELKVQKERHKRIMPEGIIRLIIQVEEPKSQ